MERAMKTGTSFGIVAACILGLAACVTINVYFPEAEIKDLSRKIEEQVREEAEALFRAGLFLTRVRPVPLG